MHFHQSKGRGRLLHIPEHLAEEHFVLATLERLSHMRYKATERQHLGQLAYLTRQVRLHLGVHHL